MTPQGEGPADRPAFRPAAPPPLVQRVAPVSEHLPAYRGRTFGRDALAGLTVAALALPAGMAYAAQAGLPPVAGLYALLLPAVAYTLLGSSRQLIIGPEGATSLLVLAAVSPLAAGGSAEYAALSATLALIVGGLFLLARLLRLGWVADYFSRPVLLGYISGVALVLMVGQLGKLLGIPVDASRAFGQLRDVVSDLGEASGATIAVSAVALALLVGGRRVLPRVPWMLVVVVGGIAASAALDLSAHGVSTIGPVPSGLPALEWPGLGGGDFGDLALAGAGIFLVAFADTLLIARSFAGAAGQHVNSGNELTAMGVANLAAGITQAYPVAASGSRTAVNASAGSRTQVAGLVAAGTIALILLFLTEPIKYLPSACLGAVIFVAAAGLVKGAEWRALRRISPVELAIALVAAVGVVLWGVLEALVLAVLLTFIDVVRRSARPHDAVLGWVEHLGRYADVQLHPSAETTPGVVVYRLDDRLFFANAHYVTGRVHEAIAAAAAPVRWLVFDAEAIATIDATGSEALVTLVGDLERQGVTLLMTRLKGPAERTLREAGVIDVIGAGNVHPTVRAAVAAARAADAGASSLGHDGRGPATA